MDQALRQALEPVLRDIGATGATEPRIEDDDWAGTDHVEGMTVASAMLWSADGNGMGVSVPPSLPPVDRIVWVADKVQEWVIEDRWGREPTNWPPCPLHPGTHPMVATVRDGDAVWACPTDNSVVSRIGSL